MSTIKTVLATLIVLSSVSFAQAGARSLVTRDAALPQAGISAAESAWFDRASQSSGGGY